MWGWHWHTRSHGNSGTPPPPLSNTQRQNRLIHRKLIAHWLSLDERRDPSHGMRDPKVRKQPQHSARVAPQLAVGDTPTHRNQVRDGIASLHDSAQEGSVPLTSPSLGMTLAWRGADGRLKLNERKMRPAGVGVSSAAHVSAAWNQLAVHFGEKESRRGSVFPTSALVCRLFGDVYFV